MKEPREVAIDAVYAGAKLAALMSRATFVVMLQDKTDAAAGMRHQVDVFERVIVAERAARGPS